MSLVLALKFFEINCSNFHFVYATGRSWFDRFALEWKEFVEFKTKGVIFKIVNDPITMKMWVRERDYYTRIQQFTKLFPSRRYIFVIESKNIQLTVTNEVSFEIMVQIYSS